MKNIGWFKRTIVVFLFIFIISGIVAQYLSSVIVRNQYDMASYNDIVTKDRSLNRVDWDITGNINYLELKPVKLFIKVFCIVFPIIALGWLCLFSLLTYFGAKDKNMYVNATIPFFSFLLFLPLLLVHGIFLKDGATYTLFGNTVHINFCAHLFFYLAITAFLFLAVKRILVVVDEHRFDGYEISLLFIFAASCVLLLANGVNSDGLQFYGFLRSIVIDRNLNLFNERIYFNPLEHFMPLSITKTGYNSLGGAYIGSSLVGVPFLVIGDIATRFMRIIGLPVELNGYTFPYRFFVSLGYSAFGFAAFWQMYKFTKQYFTRKASFLAVLGILFFTTTTFYMFFDFAFSHTISLFFVTMYLIMSIRNFGSKTLKQSLLLTLIAGAMLTVRPSNVIFLSLSLIEMLYFIIKGTAVPEAKVMKAAILKTLCIVVVFLIAYSPEHISIKHIISGGGFLPNLGGSGEGGLPYTWSRPDLLTLFFHKKGLFMVTPMALIACIGFIFMVIKYPFPGFVLIVPFVILSYTLSCFNFLYGKAVWTSFGSRYFSECAPIFVMGLASLIDFADKKIILSKLKDRILLRYLRVEYLLIGFIAYLALYRGPYNTFIEDGLQGFNTFIFGMYPYFIKELNRNYFTSLYYSAVRIWISNGIMLIGITVASAFLAITIAKRTILIEFLRKYALKIIILCCAACLMTDTIFLLMDAKADVMLVGKTVTGNTVILQSGEMKKTVAIDRLISVRKLKLISNTVNSAEIPNGTVIGRMEITTKKGQTFSKDVRIGNDVAEWALHRPDVSSYAQHDDKDIPFIATQYDRYGNGTESVLFPIKRYIITMDFGQAVKPTKITIELLNKDINWNIYNFVGQKDADTTGTIAGILVLLIMSIAVLVLPVNRPLYKAVDSFINKV